jgi:hypothetical protein
MGHSRPSRIFPLPTHLVAIDDYARSFRFIPSNECPQFSPWQLQVVSIASAALGRAWRLVW